MNGQAGQAILDRGLDPLDQITITPAGITPVQ
jgi:hypothetical protein